MRMQTKGMIAAAGIVTLAGAGIAGTNITSAMNGNSSDRQSSLIDALAEKFNLNKSEVQAVFDEQHEAHHEEMEAKRMEHLKQALSDEKITQQQYDYIVDAWKEIDSLMEAAGGMMEATDEQRQAIKDKKDELRTWMKDQDITPRTLGMGEMRGHHGARGAHMSS